MISVLLLALLTCRISAFVPGTNNPVVAGIPTTTPTEQQRPEKYLSAGIVPGTDIAIQTAFHLHQRGHVSGWQFLMDSGSGWVAAFHVDQESPEAATAGVAKFFELVGHDGGNIVDWTSNTSAKDLEAATIHREITRTVGHALMNAIYPFRGMLSPRPQMSNEGRVVHNSHTGAPPSYSVYEIPAVPSLISLLRNEISWAAAAGSLTDDEDNDDSIDFAFTVTPVSGQNTVNVLVSTPSSDRNGAADSFLAAVDNIILSNSRYTEQESAQRKLIV